MGNCCHKGKQRFSDETNNVMPVTGTIGEVVDAGAGTSAVVQWERRQKELNLQVMEKMREDFHNRPDNFLLNLLVVSFQFYQNYGREKADISNHIRDRELALDCKLSPSKRKIIYQGGLEEISGTHVLYQPSNEQYMELPTPLQIYVVQDNVEVYSEDQYEELQKMNYADVDGPAYRFCTESSQRHKGYVRLRCADIIPAMSRHNTYEDIYGFMKPSDESLPDPIVDIRPLRRNSQTLSSNDDNPMTMTPDSFSYTRSISSEFEDTDDDEPPSPPPPQRLTARRSSGVLPEHYPTGKLKERINKMKEEAHEHFSNGHPGAQIRPTRPRNLTERRPSGVFPKVGPDMDRLRLSSKQRQLMSTRDGMADIIKKLSKVEEDSEEEEEDEKQEVNVNMKKISHDEFQNDTNTETNIEIKKTKEVCLEARLNEDCFLTRRLRMKEQKDAYGITTKSERRTYFSSERYLECFEDEFEDLAKILGKEHLVDTCKMLTPAVLANELMIEHIGPKFNTEFIPTMILKEWPTCAFEWKLRERRPRADPETKMVYKWPKDQNIQEAVQLGCNLVPLGHYNPKEPNKVMKIEWQIQFAKGEQILLEPRTHS
ncbi:uncharacterized protein LOC121873395, partial [Homarus americanus]|uniref:uncharacterized protein LOC121873395 n=1 Tax=Homarus americanus TaxID=6706 RepID=UPI001C43D6FE